MITFTNTPTGNFPVLSTDKIQIQPKYKKPAQLTVDRLEKTTLNETSERPTKVLVSLLKSGLTGKAANPKEVKSCTIAEWEKLLHIADEASVTGIVLDAVEMLPKDTVPTDVKVRMKEFQAEVEEKHKLQEKILGKLTKKFSDMGIETVQLKGVGLSMDYPTPNHRFGGDIDIFTRLKGTTTTERSNASNIIDDAMVKSGIKVDDYNLPNVKHSEFAYDGVRIENHRYFVNKERLPEAKILDSILHKSLNPRPQILPNGTKILVPSKEFNSVFLAQHAFQHFIFGGIDLHHLTDWSVHVKKNGLYLPPELKGTKLETFTNAMTNLSNRYLGTNVKVPENKEYEDFLFKTLLHPEGEIAPPNLNNAEILLYKAKRFIKKAEHAKKFGGGNVPILFIKTSLQKLKDPIGLLRRPL